MMMQLLEISLTNKNLAEEKSHSPILTRICEIIRLGKAVLSSCNNGKKNTKRIKQACNCAGSLTNFKRKDQDEKDRSHLQDQIPAQMSNLIFLF